MLKKFINIFYIQQGQHLINICFFHKMVLCFFVTIMLISIGAAGQSNKKIDYISLHNGSFTFIPREFYIDQIIDEREDKTTIGHLIAAIHNPSKPVVTRSVDLKGGALTAIHQFIQQGLKHNRKLHPIVIRLKEFQITESPGSKGRVDGRVVLTMSFELKADKGENYHLVEYRRGGAHYNRPANSITAVEQAVRQSLVSALRYLNTWMNNEADSNILLAKGIKVFFTDYTQNTEKDTVFYAANRPLTWDDFREKPRLSRYAASVFPTFGYEGHSEVVEGILHIYLTLKVYVLPDNSWVTGSARDPYSLNHEQRHFDIARLVAERFKQKVQPDSLTVEDYNSIIQWQYIESFREMNHLQDQYDEETRHGLDTGAQERWNRRIDEELRSFLKENL